MKGFIYSVVASGLHDAASIDRILSPVVTELEQLGGQRVVGDELERHVPHAVVVATGGTEQAILDLVRRRHTAEPWEPVVLVAHPLHNSLPACLEALARLRRDGVAGRIVQVSDPGEPATTIADLTAIHRFQHTRLGLIGAPSDWLVASVPHRKAFEAQWGIELVDVDVAEALHHHRDAPDVEVREVAVKFSGTDAPTLATIAAAAMHPTLARVIDAHRLDAVAVRCFDFITDLHTSGCIALAELNDSGIVAGCEGDIAATVAMLLARAVLDEPSWVANPARVDVDTGHVLLAHCTVAPSLVEQVELHTHFESGIGVGLRGTFSPGPVTLLRLGGNRLERHWFAEGRIESSGDAPDLCRTQVTVHVDEPLDELLEEPLGNHLVMVRGHHRRRLERWWRLAFPA